MGWALHPGHCFLQTDGAHHLESPWGHATGAAILVVLFFFFFFPLESGEYLHFANRAILRMIACKFRVFSFLFDCLAFFFLEMKQ